MKMEISSIGGNTRDWGYTSYEKSGAVNRYVNNVDGGHSHDNWKNSNDYNNGKDPDYSGKESNSSSNPTIGKVQNNGGCYLICACMTHMQEKFDDNCEELTILRWFRNNLCSKFYGTNKEK